MRQVRFIVLAVLLAGVTSLAWAQESDPRYFEASQDGLDATLVGLKESVTRLMEENKRISAANEVRRAQVKPFRVQLAALQAEGDRLVGELKVLNERKQKKMEGLQSFQEKLSVSQLSFDQARKAGEEAEAELASQMKADADLQAQIGQLQKELKDLRSGKAMSDVKDMDGDRDRLRQELRDAAESLSRSKEEWQQAKKSSSGAERLQAVHKDQEALREAVRNRNAELINLKQRVAEQQELSRQVETQGVSSETLVQLEQEVAATAAVVKDLEKELAASLSVNGRRPHVKSARLENEESRYQELKSRVKRLRGELDRLRRQMVELDKKKFDLEQEVYKSKS